MNVRKRLLLCYVCKEDLQEEEKEFYPCNCKYQICHQCYYKQVEEKNKKCPNCDKLYEVSKVNEYIKKTTKQNIKNPFNPESEVSSIMSNNSNKFRNNDREISEKSDQSESQRAMQTSLRSQPINKLSSVRILQKNTLYVIGVSPSIAKEDILRRYEYFGQYGKILQVTINKENIYQSENQGPCFSAYITYSNQQESSIAILAIDQFIYDNRLMRASFGRTKYCKFFLKETQCLNKDCPYQHFFSESNDILTQDDMQKKQLFQQCQQLAFQLSHVYELSEEQFRRKIKTFRDQNYQGITTKPILPPPETIYERKSLFKTYSNLYKNVQIRKVRKLTTVEQQQEKVIQEKIENQTKQKSLSRDREKSQQNLLQFEVSRTKTEEKVKNNSQRRRYEEEFQKTLKRNSSHGSDKKQSSLASKNRIQTLEQQLANTLRKQLSPNKEEIGQEVISTDQTLSLFNEKKTSRFLSLKDDEDYEDHSILFSKVGIKGKTLQKKASQKSLIIDFRFLNDDTEQHQDKNQYIMFNTNPHSEIYNLMHDTTPVPSQLGEMEDNNIWSRTITSTQEMYQLMYPDHKSSISHQDTYQRNLNSNEQKNSLYTSSYFLINTQSNTQGRPSLADLNQQTFKNSNTMEFNNARRNTTNNYQGQNFNNSQIISDNMQMNRCPSQPTMNKQLNTQQQNISQQLRESQFKAFQELQIQQIHSGPFNQSLPSDQQQLNINRMHSFSYDKPNQHPLNQYNLKLLDKQFESMRDIPYAKIFLQKDMNGSNNIISSQSLFCYESQVEEEQNLKNQTMQTPIKDQFSINSIINQQEVKSTQQKNYYKEFLSVQESFISNAIYSKRRNSVDIIETSEFLPQQLQFLSPDKEEDTNQTNENKQQKRSKSRSLSRERMY